MQVSPVVLGLEGLRDLSVLSPELLADGAQGRGRAGGVTESWNHGLGCVGRHLRGPSTSSTSEISPQTAQNGL